MQELKGVKMSTSCRPNSYLLAFATRKYVGWLTSNDNNDDDHGRSQYFGLLGRF
jgi:hypothetical protein